jgi:RNase P subunit RPR2
MKDKQLAVQIAGERVSLLLSLAKEAAGFNNTKLSRRYLKIAGEIKRHYKLKDAGFKRQVCKGCNGLVLPGATCDVTVASSKRQVIYRCRSCGHENKFHY